MIHFDSPDEKKTEKELVHKAKLLQNRKQRFLFLNFTIVMTLGFIIICPILIGILFGTWLDMVCPLPPLSWRLNLLLIGLGFGLFLGWGWIKREGIQNADNRYNKERNRIKDDIS